MPGHLTDPSIWSNLSFRNLSTVAKLAYHALATNPSRKRIPGLQVLGPAALAEFMGVDTSEVLEAFEALQRSELLSYDAGSFLSVMPKQTELAATLCRNPSILLRWWSDWREMPDIDARYEYIAQLAAALNLERANGNLLCVWWGTFGSTYAAWYWRRTGELCQEPWANQPDGWYEYCRRKGAAPEDLLGENTKAWRTATLTLRAASATQSSPPSPKRSSERAKPATATRFRAPAAATTNSVEEPLRLASGDASLSPTEINLKGLDLLPPSSKREGSEKIDLSGHDKTFQVDPTSKDLMQGRERGDQRSHCASESRPSLSSANSNSSAGTNHEQQRRQGYRSKSSVRHPQQQFSSNHAVSSSHLRDRSTVSGAAPRSFWGSESSSRRSDQSDISEVCGDASYDWIDEYWATAG